MNYIPLKLARQAKDSIYEYEEGVNLKRKIASRNIPLQTGYQYIGNIPQGILIDANRYILTNDAGTVFPYTIEEISEEPSDTEEPSVTVPSTEPDEPTDPQEKPSATVPSTEPTEPSEPTNPPEESSSATTEQPSEPTAQPTDPVPTEPPVTEPSEPEYVLGDVNDDGRITSADARLALRAAVSLETLDAVQLLSADANGDGKVTSADARLILRVAVGLDAFEKKE